jgi:hypothetical protein
LLFKGRANPAKLRKSFGGWSVRRNFPTKDWRISPKVSWEHSPGPMRRSRKGFSRSEVMLGKLAGAWLGEKVAGENSGAKGAILGYGVASLARRSVPTLAALALGGWAFRKWRDRRASPSYPSDASVGS